MRTGTNLKYLVEETGMHTKRLASAISNTAIFLVAGTILFLFDEVERDVVTAKGYFTEFQTWIGNTRTRYRYQEQTKHPSPVIFLTVDDIEKLMRNLPSVRLMANEPVRTPRISDRKA